MYSTTASSRRWRVFYNVAATALTLSSLSCLPSVAGETGNKAADFFVSSMPGQPDGPLLKMHAGHIAVNKEHHGNLFFWHFANRHIANKQRTVIWLNGGPGCSSMDGALMEIGPYRVTKDGNLAYNEGSWDEFANVLFVDNPVGTGFSYVDTDSFLHDLPEMADHFVKFLEKWFDIFPEYVADDIYISGESYAGQHIPHIAKAILERNKKAGAKKPWNLSGLLIGNGWISPNEQYMAYTKYAYKEGLIAPDSEVAKRVESQVSLCQSALNGPGKGKVDVRTCEKILTDILQLTLDKNAKEDEQCTNMYDIRLKDNASCGMSWPPDLKQVGPYLQRPDVIRALHIDPGTPGWTECNGGVSSNFNAEHSTPSIELLPDLLTEVPIVLFSGDRDLICNHIGTEELIMNMQWSGGKGLELSPGVTAPRQSWEFEGEPAGFYQEARNLTYILFYNSSHMVPFDYPRRTRDMLDRFMGVDIASVGGSPVDSKLDGEKAGPETSVGGHPNSTAAQEAEKEKVQEAAWRAYQRSGEVALVIILLVVGAGAWWMWRERSKRAGYTGLFSSAANGGGPGGLVRPAFSTHSRGANSRDLEAADFDEHELDNHPNGHANGAARGRYDDSDAESEEGRPNGEKPKKLYDQPETTLDEDHYDIGGDSDDDEDNRKGRR